MPRVVQGRLVDSCSAVLVMLHSDLYGILLYWVLRDVLDYDAHDLLHGFHLSIHLKKLIDLLGLFQVVLNHVLNCTWN